MKRIATVLAVLLMLLPVAALGSNYPEATPAFYINDYSDVMRSDDINTILSLGDQVETRCTGAQIVGVVVPFLDGIPVEDYAYDLFRAWGIGAKDKNNGVLILLSTGDREIYVQVGTGLDKTLSASVIGNLIDDNAISYLSANNFSGGMRALYQAIGARVAQFYGVSLVSNWGEPTQAPVTNGGTSNQGNATSSDGDSIGGAMSIILGIIVIVGIIWVLGKIFGSGGGGNNGCFGPGCLFGWMLGRGSAAPQRRGFFGGMPRRAPPPRGGGFGSPPRSGGFGSPPRSNPPSSSGGGFGTGFGGGTRTGGGGTTRGVGAGRGFGGSNAPKSGGFGSAPKSGGFGGAPRSGGFGGPRVGGGGGTRGVGGGRKF